jgi:glycosyltransferase involved in cell wall biosynthesis
VSVTVITATRNSAQLVERHYHRVVEHLEAQGESFDIVYVDDGSADGSAAVISDIARHDPRVGGLFLDRSCGQQTALIVGVAAMSGDSFASLDVDLEVPADVIGRFLDAIAAGADYVVGRRNRRRGRGIQRVFGSVVFNVSMRVMTGLPISDFGCGASAGTRALATRAFHRTVPFRGIMHLLGQLADKIVEVPVPEVGIPGHRSAYGVRELVRTLTVEHGRRVRLELPPRQWISATENVRDRPMLAGFPAQGAGSGP